MGWSPFRKPSLRQEIISLCPQHSISFTPTAPTLILILFLLLIQFHLLIPLPLALSGRVLLAPTLYNKTTLWQNQRTRGGIPS